MALVYMATNTVNGKRYIGFSSQTLEARKQQHLYEATREKPKMVFAKAIKKYGADNFKFEIVRDGLSKSRALKLEARLIAKLKPEYNVASGGQNPNYEFRWKPVILLEAGMVFSSVKQAAKDLDIGREFIARVCRGGKPGHRALSANGMHFAYYHDNFTEEELQARLTAIKHLEQSYPKTRGVRRPVICVTDGNKCPSLKAAAETYGLCHKYVRKLCHSG